MPAVSRCGLCNEALRLRSLYSGMRSFNIEVHEMKAIVMNRPGSTEVLEVVDRPDPVAGPGQALVEVAAAGVNFMDTGVRRGQFWTEMPLPRGLGVEGMGRVLAVGNGVNSVQPGQRSCAFVQSRQGSGNATK
jgi:NADPH:quinone reductase-like Zn-dependent oxidoreductase